MTTFKYLWQGMGFAAAVVAYVAFVVVLMTNMESILGPGGPAFMGGVLILLLFVLSAAVVGSLIFGRPAYLYFSSAKRDGVILAASIMVWLLVFTVLVVVSAVCVRLYYV
ncbi:MAG: hypothetical protein WC246_01180 [Candidatus Paceibacterota bacterium]|jgi:hypothetical protein